MGRQTRYEWWKRQYGFGPTRRRRTSYCRCWKTYSKYMNEFQSLIYSIRVMEYEVT